MDGLKDAQKSGLPEDDFKRGEKEVQKKTDESVEKINQALSAKRRIFVQFSDSPYPTEISLGKS